MRGYIMLDPYMYTLMQKPTKPMKFEMGKWYKTKSFPFGKKEGFHFCKSIYHIPVMYGFVYSQDSHLQNRIFEVEADDIIFNYVEQAKAKKICLVREIPKTEWDTQEMREMAAQVYKMVSSHYIC